MLGLSNNLSRPGIVAPGIVTNSLVLKHNYAAGGVVPVSDGAAFFDGTDDYIDTGTGIDLGSTTDFTITCWAKAGDWTSQMLMGKFVDSSNRWYFTTNGSDILYFFSIAGAANGIVYTGTTALTNGEWTHIALVADRSENAKGYINGVLDNTDTEGGGENFDLDIDISSDFNIGKVSSDFFSGNICNVGIWSVALTQPQVKSIMWKNYAGLTSSETTNLVSWWNLDEETATDGTAGSGGVKDHEGSNHGTLS